MTRHRPDQRGAAPVPESGYLLQVVDLRKRFAELMAVDGVSFGIRPGTCFGLLGPNGAGKTTTIEMIEGISRPDSGRILYRDRPRDGHFKEVCGIQFQATQLPDFLRVREVLDLFRSFYRAPLPRERLIADCELGEFTEREANKLSGGQKQRLLLALALVNDPEILFLDEPTTGLDPQSRRRFWELIASVRAGGKTVVLTTHYMDEAELLCDELAIMDFGRIIARGSPRDLLNRHLPHKRIRIDYAVGGIDLQRLSGRLIPADDALEIVTDSVDTTLQELLDQNLDLSSLRVHNPTLEDLFLELTGHQLRE